MTACGERRFAALALLLLAAAPGRARADVEDGAKVEMGAVDIRSLLDLNVDAVTRRSERASQAPANVFVLTREDIRRNGFRTLYEVLGSVPGLFSYPGTFPQVGVRGMGILGDFTTRLLVLVDGHPLTNALGVDVGRALPVPLEAVSRVEVIKGPVGSVYGPSAFFGVVNLVTTDAATGSEVWAGGEAAQGSVRAGEASAALRGRSGALEGLVSADVYRTSGLDWTYPELAGLPRQTADGKVVGMDYGDAANGYAHARWRGLDASVACGHSYAGVPQLATGDRRTAMEALNCFTDLAYQARVTDRLTLKPRLALDVLEQRAGIAQLPPPSGLGLFQNKGHDRWVTAELRADWKPLPALRVDVGTTLQAHGIYHHSFSDQVPGLDVSQTKDYRSLNNWLLAEVRLGDAVALHGGITYFYHSLFGDRVTPKLAVVWQPTPADTVKAIWATGFRPPTFVEAFVQDAVRLLANPDLRPEAVSSAEVVYEHRFGGLASASASVFRNEYRDLIRFVVIPLPGLTAPPTAADLRQQSENSPGSLRLVGGEVALRLRWEEWVQAYGGVSVQRVDEADRPNFPGVTANVSLSSRALWRPLLLTARATAISGRAKDTLSTSGTVPAAVSLGALAALDVPGVDGLTLEASISNALDARNASPAPTESAPVNTLPESARTVRADLRWRF